MIRYAKRAIAAIVASAMLFSIDSVPLAAYDSVQDYTAVNFEAEDAVEAPVFNEGEDGGQTPEPTANTEKGTLEINQGFSYHVKKDIKKSESATYMSNFVASKKTYIMYPVDAADEAAAKEATKDWELYFKPKDSDEKKLTWKGEEFSYQKYYDENSNEVSGKLMAYVSMSTGPSKGNYNFYLEKGGTVIAEATNVDFYETRALNVLAVPVTSYYSQSANVPENNDYSKKGGGCPSDKINKGVECDSALWNGITDKIKTYLLDVYPVAEVNVDEGNVFDASDSSYDMCTSDGQKKLWDECCKLQSKNKEGKDKYDIILAFVMYRQDANGCGQGYTFGKPVNIITLTDPDMLPTVAHEIAHCYEIGDEYSGGSYNYRTNNVPLEYKDTARDKVTGDEVKDSTEYTFNNVKTYESKADDYYWLSGGQYKAALANDAKPAGKDKANVDENGSGTVIYPSLHPFKLSTGTFVHYAVEGDNVYPTISYMGSGYSGCDDYYFTTTVIWDHLFNEFMVKEKKEDASSTSTESFNSFGVMAEEDDGLELFYDEDIRWGDSRMVEVSGVINYVSPLQAIPVVSGLQVDPMFSYDGDLEYIEPLDLNEADKKELEDEVFVFAAIGEDGKVVMSPVDGEPAIVEFYGGTFNDGMPAPKPVSGMQVQDKRIQDFCNFSFDAEYPYDTKEDKSLTSAFVIMKYKDYSKDKTYAKDTAGVLWYKKTPDKIIDGEMKNVDNKDDHSSYTLTWDAAAYDIDGNPTTKDLYTMLYYAPKGDDGEVFFLKDGDLEKDFGFNAANGTATFTFKPTDYVKADEITPYEYVWIKVSDGVNGLDLYSDEYTLTKVAEKKAVTIDGTLNGENIKLTANISYSKGATYTGKKITAGQLAVASDADETGKQSIVRFTVSGMQSATTPKGKNYSDLLTFKITPNSKKKVGDVGAFKIKVSVNTKVLNKAGFKSKEKKAIKKELTKLAKDLTEELKKLTFEYEIEPINLTFVDDVKIKSTFKKQKVTIDGAEKKKNVVQVNEDGTLKKLKSVKVKVTIPGIKKAKTFTFNASKSKKQFKVTVTDQANNIADIEPASTGAGYTGFFKGKRKDITVKK